MEWILNDVNDQTSSQTDFLLRTVFCDGMFKGPVACLQHRFLEELSTYQRSLS